MYLQGTNEEHDCHADLLLPVKVEVADLPHGDCNHPNIQGDTDCRVCPSDGITVKTVSLLAGRSNGVGVMTGSSDLPFALVLAIPVCPEKADGRALESRKKHKRNAKYSVYDNS